VCRMLSGGGGSEGSTSATCPRRGSFVWGCRRATSSWGRHTKAICGAWARTRGSGGAWARTRGSSSLGACVLSLGGCNQDHPSGLASMEGLCCLCVMRGGMRVYVENHFGCCAVLPPPFIAPLTLLPGRTSARIAEEQSSNCLRT